MRQYAWYSPEINVIALQSIMEDCHISFEWGADDAYEHLRYLDGTSVDDFLWIPLGEL